MKKVIFFITDYPSCVYSPFLISWMLVWSCHFLPAWNFGHCSWMCKFSKYWSLHNGCTWKWQCLYFLHLCCTWIDQLIMLTCRNNFKSNVEKPIWWVQSAPHDWNREFQMLKYIKMSPNVQLDLITYFPCL